MKIMIDESRIKELIRHILRNDFDIYEIDEINSIEEEILRRFDEKEVIGFIYSYINKLLKNIIKNND
jgi:hypothetical protein